MTLYCDTNLRDLGMFILVVCNCVNTQLALKQEFTRTRVSLKISFQRNENVSIFLLSVQLQFKWIQYSRQGKKEVEFLIVINNSKK